MRSSAVAEAVFRAGVESAGPRRYGRSSLQQCGPAGAPGSLVDCRFGLAQNEAMPLTGSGARRGWRAAFPALVAVAVTASLSSCASQDEGGHEVAAAAPPTCA